MESLHSKKKKGYWVTSLKEKNSESYAKGTHLTNKQQDDLCKRVRANKR